MRVAGLFAGIGGFEVGLASAGHETSLLVEIDHAANAVLAAHFPRVERLEDVRSLRGLPSEIDLLVAGFPCQDLSQAGRTLGLDGGRSSLVAEVFRLARTARPSWIVLENVPFMLQLDKGAAIRRIVDELEDAGYSWAWRVVDSFGFGLPQRRERVFVVASRVSDPSHVLLADDAPIERPKTAVGSKAHGFYWTEGRGGLGWAPDAIPTLKNGSTIGIPSPPAILLSDGSIVKPDIRDAERLQGFAQDWTTPAETVTRAGMRWRLVGSAVSVPVATWLGHRLTSPSEYDVSRDRVFDISGPMPRAARSHEGQRHTVSISPDPTGVQPEPLEQFLHHAGQPLSARATSGFLSRTRVAKLRFDPRFLEFAEMHLARMVMAQ